MVERSEATARFTLGDRPASALTGSRCGSTHRRTETVAFQAYVFCAAEARTGVSLLVRATTIFSRLRRKNIFLQPGGLFSIFSFKPETAGPNKNSKIEFFITRRRRLR